MHRLPVFCRASRPGLGASNLAVGPFESRYKYCCSVPAHAIHHVLIQALHFFVCNQVKLKVVAGIIAKVGFGVAIAAFLALLIKWVHMICAA